MNARTLPQNVTSQSSAYVSPDLAPLPNSWIAKIFAKFEGRYGSLFIDRWKDCNMTNVMETWAEELAGFADQPDRIAYALRALADHKFPPTLPEFIAACRHAPAKDSAPALGYTPTAEDRQRTREAAEAAAKALKPKVSDGIDRHWATHPRSALQLKMIFDAAKRDQRFAPCVAEMVADGICTADGHLLKQYRDRQFFKVAA